MSETTQVPASPAPTMIAAASQPLPPTPLALALSSGDRAFRQLAETCGMNTPALFSDAAQELSALTTAAAAFDRGYRLRVRIAGQDRVRWLNGMVTNTVKALTLGSHNYTFVLNAQGRIQGDAIVFAFPDHLILETDRSQSAHLLAHFEHFIIMDDVELAPITAQTTLGLAGPASATILGALNLPAPSPGTFTTADWERAQLTVVAEGDVAEENVLTPRFSLWIADSDIERLWTALLTAGAIPAGAVALHSLRVLEATPLYGADISEKTLAQETGQARALNFNKGCYLGQEIVERVRSRANVHRGIRQFALNGAPAAPGTPIFAATDKAEGAAIGELTSIATIELPGSIGQLALGTVRTEALDRGAQLTYAGGTATWLAHPPIPAIPAIATVASVS